MKIMDSFLCHYCALLSLHLLLVFTQSTAETTASAMYVFGDSLIDVGNNNYLPLSILKANLPYNGIDYPGGKPTGRFSNGKNAADFVAEKLGLPTPPPYLARPNNAYVKGVSFASGGAGILNSTNENLIKQTIPMFVQEQHFSTVRQRLVNEMGPAAVQQHLSKALIPVVFGSNDIIRYFGNGSEESKKYSPQQYVNLMASTVTEFFKGIHGLGARKFLVIGVPLVGCAPRQRFRSPTEECNTQVNYWSNKYNDELTKMLLGLKSELEAFQYTYFDTYNALLELIQNAATYGFNDTKSACCGVGKLRAQLPCTPIAVFCKNRTANMFWDIYHPTEATAHIAIDMLFRGQYVSPMTVQQLIFL